MKRAGLMLGAFGAAVLLLVVAGAIYRSAHHTQRRSLSPAQQHYQQGLRLAQRGQPNAAVYQWNTAIGLDPTFAPAYLALAQQDEQRDDLIAAAGSLEHLRAADPRAAHITSRLAGLYLRAGRYEKGLALAREAVQREPDDPFAHVALGESLEQGGEATAGVQELRAAFRLAPGDEAILFDLAQSLGHAGSADEGLALMHPLLTRTTNPARAYFVMGELLMRQRSSQAEAYLRKSLSLVPDQQPVESDLGSLLLREGRPAEAQPLLERAYRQDPADAQAIQDLATVYARLHRPAARQAWQEASAFSADHAMLLRARRRYLSHPEDSHNNLLLAQLEAQRGDGPDAIDLVMQVLHNNPNDPTALVLLHRIMGH